MSIEIKAPVLPESVADATVIKWHKKAGDPVKRDENLVDLETDKVVLEVAATADGVLTTITAAEGARVKTGELLGTLTEGAAANSSKPAPAPVASPVEPPLSPSVRRAVAEHQVDVSTLSGTGKDGRLTKADVTASLTPAAPTPVPVQQAVIPAFNPTGERQERRVPMSRLRQRIAERLLQATQTTAMLTTFNEVNLKEINVLRERYKEKFEKQHGVRLGYMSFFTRAAVEALKRFPEVNACLDGDEIVYHDYYDVGIAVSTDRGLIVPVLRNADRLSFAQTESAIKQFAEKARQNQISLEDMTGGTFTITNGGAFGSLLSTPILNPPQSAILGMHGIQDRPVAEQGQVVIRPMMYLALSYDHRIIDGKQSVLFLKTIKELLEEPAQLLLGL